jgi:hypothetical protein
MQFVLVEPEGQLRFNVAKLIPPVQSQFVSHTDIKLLVESCLKNDLNGTVPTENEEILLFPNSLPRARISL